MKTITFKNILESEDVFHSQKWKLNGFKIVSISSRPEFLHEGLLPDGFILVTIWIEKSKSNASFIVPEGREVEV
tara:strand:+ start:154 stop:375 length:222 start_codon:yes stop_codon:yes gene_type:complete